MKIVFVFCLAWFVYSCKQSESRNVGVAEINKSKDITGVYHYVYPYNTPDLNEDHYLILEQHGDSLKGRYYGTSDEFEEAREGYLPGFFVADMHRLILSADTLAFQLNVPKNEFFEKPIPQSILSSKYAKEKGYRLWANTEYLDTSKYYRGIFKGDSIYFPGRLPDFDRYFVRAKK